MEEYWIISVPQENSACDTYAIINNLTNEMSTNSLISPPDFTFGAIDSLIKFSEDASIVNQNAELLISKLVQNINSLLDDREELTQNLQVNGTSVNNYLQKFKWDYTKYPTRKKAQTIIANAFEQATLIFEKMKTKVSEFNGLKNEVEKIETKHTGSLLARDLSDFVKKEDILLDSKFLQTVLILVPTIDIENWRCFYEHFWHGIVPGSSKLLYRDHDFGLFTVIVTKATAEAFKSWSLKSRIIVRKFEYNEDEIKKGKMNECKKKMELTVNRRNLEFWLKKHYSLCFSMYVHVQILRLMSESILKYGLTQAYTVMVMEPKPKYSAKIRKTLDTLFSSLEEIPYPDHNKESEIDEHPYYTYPHCGNKDYHPYANCCIYSTGMPMKTKLQLVESITKGGA